jgi:hypothetical protein
MLSTLDDQSLVALACRLAGRGLSESEWATDVPGHPFRQTCP